MSDLLYENVIVRSATDPEMVTPMLAGIAVSNKYSEDLGFPRSDGVGVGQAVVEPGPPTVCPVTRSLLV